MTGVLTRRAAIAALAVAPAVATASTAINTSSDGWTAALRRYRKAQTAYETHLATVWNPLQERLDAMCPQPPSSVTCEHRPGVRSTFTYNSKRPDAWMWEPRLECRRMGEKLSEEWAAWFRRYEAAENDMGAARVHAEDIRLFDEVMAAKDRLMLLAAPDAAAVLTKLELMWDNPYEDRQEENERLIRRDLRAIADLAGSRRAA